MRTRVAVLFVCFVAGVGLVARAERPEPVPNRTSFDRFPMVIEKWRGVQEPPIDANILAVLGVDDYLTRAYFPPERSGVGLYIGYYGSQRQGDTMHSPLNCLPGSGWEPVSKSYLPISMAAGSPDAPDGSNPDVVVNRYVVQKGLDRVLVLYWYQSHGRVVASEYWGKFYLVRDAIRLNRTDGALVRVIASIDGDDGDASAERTAVGFVKAVFPVLSAYLPA
jgi:EpsI family protein